MSQPTARRGDGARPAGFQPVGDAAAVERWSTGVRLHAGDATVDVVALAADLFRVGLFPRGRTPGYASEALARQDWPPVATDLRDAPGGVRLATAAATAVVQLGPLRIGFEDTAGRSFATDDPELGMGTLPSPAPISEHLADALGPAVRVYKTRPPTERTFGCGERTGGLEKTGSRQTFWNVDPPLWHTASHDNLYSSTPFVLALDERDGRAWGLFLDNAGRVQFDLAKERSDRYWFGADLGSLVYYVFAGPTPRDVLERFTELTGRTPLPPLWALGYHQSRWGYETAEALREVARQFRAHDIPCDALYLDIDYMDGYRVFTWDRARFPDPAGLVSELAAEGFKVVTIVDPGVKVDERYPVYTRGRDANFFCTTYQGEEYHNVVWPGVCAFPDFTSPRVRAWWGELHAALLDAGVAGIWCDMNEPSLGIPRLSTIPPDVVHPGGGTPRLHAEVHNLYGMLMARATREGLLRLRPETRPFVISRAGYAGLQRYALQWTGDNSSWWEHLWMSMPQLQNLGLSGQAWVGVDIGGFWEDATGELLARWTEFGVFQPFCRNHSARGTRPQEPWAFGEPYESAIRNVLKLRQRLIPYLYTAFEECHRTGAPLLRPLLFAYPEDPTTYATDDEFLVGDALLVAPIAQAGVKYRHVYLPAGTWFHYWTGQRLDGPGHVLAHAPLGEPAVYVRANTPVPLWPEMRHVGEQPPDPLTLLVYAAEGRGTATLYEDAGDGFGYQQGVFARTAVACQTSAQRVRVSFGARQGTFQPARSSLRLELRGLAAAPREVRVDGASISDWQVAEGTVVVPLRAFGGPTEVEAILP